MSLCNPSPFSLFMVFRLILDYHDLNPHSHCSASITRSGRQGVAASSVQTRASENLQESVKFSRAIFSSLGMSSSFNGISACWPEISLLAYAHAGPTPGLLSLKMEEPRRKEIERHILRSWSRLQGFCTY